MKKRVAVLAAVLAMVGVGYEWADVDNTADRMNNSFQAQPAPPPPPSAREVCNSLQYFGWDSGPPLICFRAIAAERRWHESTIQAWQGWVITDPWSVTQGESMQCWNIRGRDHVSPGVPCEQKTSARNPAEDTGFGQMTYVLYGPKGVLCVQHGYCGSASILASPYDSMKPVLLMIELGRPNGGSDPWCYDADARAYHQCWRAPDR